MICAMLLVIGKLLILRVDQMEAVLAVDDITMEFTAQVDGGSGVFRTLLVLCFRALWLGSRVLAQPRSSYDILGLSEGGHICISVRFTRQCF